jgi:hypothetical protein
MADYLDRYSEFRINGGVKVIPGIKIPLAPTDKRVIYKVGQTRFDILSQKYYNTPYCGFLIMLANPQYGGLEFDVKDRDVIRIPFPFPSAAERYVTAVNEHKKLYG